MFRTFTDESNRLRTNEREPTADYAGSTMLKIANIAIEAYRSSVVAVPCTRNHSNDRRHTARKLSKMNTNTTHHSSFNNSLFAAIMFMFNHVYYYYYHIFDRRAEHSDSDRAVCSIQVSFYTYSTGLRSTTSSSCHDADSSLVCDSSALILFLPHQIIIYNFHRRSVMPDAPTHSHSHLNSMR